MYYVRRSATARKLLGSGIKFRDSIPWIAGSLDFLHGDVDLAYKIIGSKGVPATLHFKSVRRHRGQPFEMAAWELTFEDGRVVDLLAEDDEKPLIAIDDDVKNAGK